MGNIKVYDKIQKDYKNIQNAKKRIDKSLKFKIDKEKTYEWLFLFSVTLFENYIEELFIQILKNKIKWKRWSWIKLESDFLIQKDIPIKTVKKIILWEKNWEYLDWIPYRERTMKRSKKYLIDWKPFVLPDNKLIILEQIITIRHYIAHRSIESKRNLEKSLRFKFFSIDHLFSKTFRSGYTYFDNYLLELNSICWIIQKDLIDN